ncbi:helix-turn-helix transcriptional regulator [Dactylosporangium matsuzakiense]|uniref:Transcriptional regulator n=1 Tax=Dactylosporangium matsuzakiense TaxID=53360 RepID=A0A9W6KNW5_9ACTN|nr:WYL domain-containing protein [Dactylosporangium matsuzakiense]UWZ41840.1 WYL domain-containing protein [Dactylosporangium matsuzakiense]GLL05506.1 transcriptional regulator [Dactylosporangium matsuzakiense]
MRVSRLISLVLLLQSGGSRTAAELAAQLEVSERTIYRDILALSAAGVPVYAEQGRAGGYRLLDGYRTRLNGLSRAEAEALFLSGLPGPARDMGLGEALAAAELKVTAALPGPLRAAAAQGRQRFHLDAPGWFRDPQPPPFLAELARAVWEDRVAELTYAGRGGEVHRTAEPLGLVLKHGVWYVVARPADTGNAGTVPGGGTGHGARTGPVEPRTYRVDRIRAVTVTDVRFARDDAFDLPSFWQRRAAEFERAMLRDTVTVRLSPAGLRALRYAVEAVAYREAVDGAGPPGADGWVTVALPVESVPVAYTQLLALGPEVEAVAPAELRALLAAAAERTAALYRR